ncbi:piggyBac transposable element-derived protein 4-like [Parasteatoda tepidariorum]|uniref:piggyBac transposable element-derived protein 4-like n=1 Tax=Parasteatoda tepidariorum TaxID=114398 RepID=UPI001C7231D4|nr:piggyBac transposable element-derived protein 5-like [Parasteatoda tepidariorum]
MDHMKKSIGSRGTLNTCGKFLPKELKSCKLDDAGHSKVFQGSEFPNLLCTVWKDKKKIFMLSTTKSATTTNVNLRIGGTVKTLDCPTVFSDYNKFMGGVYLADQKRKNYESARKSRKWWLYVFWFSLDTAVHNSFIIYSLSQPPNNKKP